jgi:hypothetical protein
MPVFVVALLLVVVAVSIYTYVARANYLLKKWARDNGFELLSASFRPIRKGPYMWSSRGQAVFRVEARDVEGRTRQGWVRCGRWLTGVYSNQVEHRWDEDH